MTARHNLYSNFCESLRIDTLAFPFVSFDICGDEVRNARCSKVTNLLFKKVDSCIPGSIRNLIDITNGYTHLED